MKGKIVLILIALLTLAPAISQSFQIIEKSCQGNYVVAKVLENNVVSYRILDFCPFGCMYGSCLAKKELPQISLKEAYDVKACQDNVIFFDVKNEGTRGDISLSLEGEAAKWIRIPSKISLNSNESKTLALIASVPCNVSGAYQFTLVGNGVISFYAPSSLIINKGSKVPITTTIAPIDPKIALSLLIVFVLFVIFYQRRAFMLRSKEEKF